MNDLPGVCVKSLSVPSSSTAYLSCSQQVLERCRGSSPALIAPSRDCFTSVALALLPPICQATQLSALPSCHKHTSAALQSSLVWFSIQGLQHLVMRLCKVCILSDLCTRVHPIQLSQGCQTDSKSWLVISLCILDSPAQMPLPKVPWSMHPSQLAATGI